MYPQTHFLASFLIAMFFVKFGIFNYKIAFFVALVGFLIDMDHFIVYAFKYKEINFKQTWNKAVKGLYYGRSFIHHNVGFAFITATLIFLFYYNKSLFWILGLGYYSHMFVDYTQLNVLKIREKMVIREEGFVVKINKFEVLLDIFLATGIILLWI